MAISLTPLEKESLEKVGWKEGDPIPDNLHEILAKLSEGGEEAAVESEVLSSSSDEVEPNETVGDEDLTPEERESLHAELKAKAEGQAAVRDTLENLSQTPSAPINPSEFSPGVGAALQQMEAIAAADESPETASESEDTEESFAGAPELTDCPHCAWPLNVPDIPEPDSLERQSFVQSVLGLKPFPKQYSLLGGAVRVTFRTLTAQEIDAVYAQAFHEQHAAKIQTNEDFWERINRLRMFLQVVSLESDAFQHDLPEGLSKKTNKVAGSYWEDEEGDSDNVFDKVEAKILNDVLPTESMNRIVTNVCGRFNRLVSKMEAMVDRPDFWNTTGSPT
jgi:hypothetical protein